MKAHTPRLGHGCGPWSGSMGGRGELAVDEAGRAELERLGRSAARREADRARAVLWSLDGETSATIAARLGVRAEQARRRRPAVRSGRGAAARAVPGDLRAARVADRPVWTRARLAAEIRARTGETVSPGHLSLVLRKGATAGGGHGTPSKGGTERE